MVVLAPCPLPLPSMVFWVKSVEGEGGSRQTQWDRYCWAGYCHDHPTQSCFGDCLCSAPQQRCISHTLFPVTQVKSGGFVLLPADPVTCTKVAGSAAHARFQQALPYPWVLGRELQQSPKPAGGDPAAGGEAESPQSRILPVPQPQPVAEPFKEPRWNLLPAQHDAVPLTGAESWASAQLHSPAKNSPECHLSPECDGFGEGRPIFRS